MGCDIHAFIEVNHKRQDTDWWELFAEPNITRNYDLFSIMAGVRGKTKYSRKPKGMPKDAGWGVLMEYLYFVLDEGQPSDHHEVTRATAESWLRGGGCSWWDDKHITGPDWHTPSWLGVTEMKSVIQELNEITDGLSWENCSPENQVIIKRNRALNDLGILATVDAMERLASMGSDVRLVFWFDN